MVDRNDRHFLGQNALCLFIKRLRVFGGFAVFHELVISIIVELTVVVARIGGQQIKVGGGFVIVATPRIARHVVVLVLHAVGVDLPLVVIQRHVHVDLLEHLRRGDSDLFVIFRGVVLQCQIQRLVGAIACFGHQLFCLLNPLRLIHVVSPVQLGTLEIGNRPMGPVIRRLLPALQDTVDDDVAVDRIGQRLAHARILQRFGPLFADVQHVDIGAVIGG